MTCGIRHERVYFILRKVHLREGRKRPSYRECYLEPAICSKSSYHVARSSTYLVSPNSVLQNIKLGQLVITTTTGRTYVFGPSALSAEDRAPDHKPNRSRAELRVLSDVFWIRLCCMGDLGFSEAYMFGEVECPDLIATFKVRLIHCAQFSAKNYPRSFSATDPTSKHLKIRALHHFCPSRRGSLTIHAS